MASDFLTRLAVHRIRAISLEEKLTLLSRLQSPSDVASLTLEGLHRLIGRRTRIRSWRPSDWLREAETDRKGLTAGDFECTFYDGPGYPPLLREIYDPPFVLYHRGKLQEAGRETIAVVGTRRPSGAGRKAAFEFGLDAGRRGGGRRLGPRDGNRRCGPSRKRRGGGQIGCGAGMRHRPDLSSIQQCGGIPDFGGRRVYPR